MVERESAEGADEGRRELVRLGVVGGDEEEFVVGRLFAPAENVPLKLDVLSTMARETTGDVAFVREGGLCGGGAEVFVGAFGDNDEGGGALSSARIDWFS